MPTSLYGKQRKSLLEPGQDNNFSKSPAKMRDKGKSFDIDPEVYDDNDLNEDVSGLHS